MTNLTKDNFKQIFTGLGYIVEPEYKFCSTRKFRADWKVSKNNKSILVEYEGVVSAKARHTSITGYSKDCEKYNLMTKLGYKFLRYTVLNFNEAIADLEQVTGLGSSSLPSPDLFNMDEIKKQKQTETKNNKQEQTKNNLHHYQ